MGRMADKAKGICRECQREILIARNKEVKTDKINKVKEVIDKYPEFIDNIDVLAAISGIGSGTIRQYRYEGLLY